MAWLDTRVRYNLCFELSVKMAKQHYFEVLTTRAIHLRCARAAALMRWIQQNVDLIFSTFFTWFQHIQSYSNSGDPKTHLVFEKQFRLRRKWIFNEHRGASWRIAVVRPPENSLPMEVPLECLSHPFKASRVASRQKLLVVSLKVERKDWDNLKNRGDSLFVMIQFSCLEFRVIGYHDTLQFLWATGGQGNHVPCGHACHPHNPFWLALSGSVSVIKLIHDTSSDAHNSIYRTKRIVCRCL